DLQRAPRPGDDDGRELTGRAGEREHGAVVVGIEVDVERGRAERSPDRVDRRPVAPFREVRDGEQRGGHTRSSPSTERPASRACCPSPWSDAASTTTSRWIETDTVPPMPALAPKATWTVPRIFSSSSTSPVSCARSLVPPPSSARLVPASPCATS